MRVTNILSPKNVICIYIFFHEETLRLHNKNPTKERNPERYPLRWEGLSKLEIKIKRKRGKERLFVLRFFNKKYFQARRLSFFILKKKKKKPNKNVFKFQKI